MKVRLRKTIFFTLQATIIAHFNRRLHIGNQTSASRRDDNFFSPSSSEKKTVPSALYLPSVCE